MRAWRSSSSAWIRSTVELSACSRCAPLSSSTSSTRSREARRESPRCMWSAISCSTARSRSATDCCSADIARSVSPSANLACASFTALTSSATARISLVCLSVDSARTASESLMLLCMMACCCFTSSRLRRFFSQKSFSDRSSLPARSSTRADVFVTSFETLCSASSLLVSVDRMACISSVFLSTESSRPVIRAHEAVRVPMSWACRVSASRTACWSADLASPNLPMTDVRPSQRSRRAANPVCSSLRASMSLVCKAWVLVKLACFSVESRIIASKSESRPSKTACKPRSSIDTLGDEESCEDTSSCSRKSIRLPSAPLRSSSSCFC
mmetsp:Transcript_22085/g.62807  ORF Transcript_22085/g.62807 Transcript_22085/m.62807 type:complete len:327 (+) Transcript_22085:369-1349(+)